MKIKLILITITIAILLYNCNKEEEELLPTPHNYPEISTETVVDCIECPEKVEVLEASNSQSYKSNSTNNNDLFIKEASDKALNVCKNSKVPPSIIVAQAILESGYGKSTLTKRTNNIFNHMYHVKGKGITGFTIANDKDKHGRVKQYKFAVYKTVWYSYKSHVELLERKYSSRLPNHGKPSERWAAALCGCSSKQLQSESKKAKFVYASSCMWKGRNSKSHYVEQLLSIIKKYNLNDLDLKWSKRV